MACKVVKWSQTVAIMCGSFSRAGKPCEWCKKKHTKLCDWESEPYETCDRLMCDDHAKKVGRNKDYCPAHQ